MIRIKRFLSIFFVLAWVAGEAPRLWWKEILSIRPMDVAAVLLVMLDITGRIRGIRRTRGGRAIPVIAGVLAASWILGLRLWLVGEATVGLLYLMRTLVYFWLIWRAKEIFMGVRRWVPAAMAAFLILGLGQYVFLPDMRFLLRYGWDEHYWRLIGTVLDPNYMGVMAGMIGFYFLDKNYKNYKFNKEMAMILMAAATLALTWSRASWLAFGAAAGWWAVSGRPGRPGRLGRLGIFGVLAVLGVGVWWAAPKPGGEGVNLLRTSSIQQRLLSWNQAIGVWKQHPWLGVGFNNYGGRAPSSSWLLLLATLGVLGSLGILGEIREIGGIRNSKFWLGIIIMVSVHAIFNNTLFYPPVLGLVAMMRVRGAR